MTSTVEGQVVPDGNTSWIHFTLQKGCQPEVTWCGLIWDNHPFVDGSDRINTVEPVSPCLAPISVQINARDVTESFGLIWDELNTTEGEWDGSSIKTRLEQQEKSPVATGPRELVNLDFFPSIFYMLINQSMNPTVILIFQACYWIEFVTLQVKVLHSLPFWLN